MKAILVLISLTYFNLVVAQSDNINYDSIVKRYDSISMRKGGSAPN